MGSTTTTGTDGAPAEEGEGGEAVVSEKDKEEEDTTTTATATSLWGSATAALGSWGDVASSLVKPSDPDAEEELCENLENSIKQAESAALGAVTSIFGTLSEAANTASLATLTEAVASASGGTNIFELDKLQEEERKKDARKQRIQESLDYYLEKYPTCSEATYEEWIEYYLANYEGAWDHDANADAEAHGNDAHEKKIDDSYYAEASVHRNLWNRRIYEDSNGGNDPKRSYVEAKDKKKDDNKEDKNKSNKKAIRTKDGALVDEKDEEIVFVPSDEDAEAEGKEKEESAATGAKKENTETTDATTAEGDKGATKDDAAASPPQEELETKSVEDVVVVVPKKAAAEAPAPSAKTEPTKPPAAAAEGLDSDLDDLLS